MLQTQLNLLEIVDSFFKKDGLLSQYFKNFEYRESQHIMALKVAEMFENGGTYIIESGTGTGKTFAYLIPALLSENRTVISTKTKNLQEQLFFKDLSFLKDRFNFNVSSIFIKGRNNYVCLKKLNKLFGKSLFFDKEIDILKEWVNLTETGDISELNHLFANQTLINLISSNRDTCFGIKCEYFKSCFINKLKIRAEKCDIIIVNHHLLFSDIKIKKHGFGKVLPEYKYLICDEAHSIEDIATEHFSESISKFQLMFLISEISEFSENQSKILQNITEELFEEFKNSNEQRKSFNEFNIDKILKKANLLLSEFQNTLPLIEDESLTSKCLEIINIIDKIFFENSSNFVKWVEFGIKNITINFTPIDISSYISDFLNNLNGALLTSATLSINNNFSFFKSRLGILETAFEKIFPSPFDYSEQMAVFIPQNIPEPFDKNFVYSMTDYLIKLLKITEGNALLLFTSLKNMNDTAKLLKEKTDFQIFVQGESSNIDLIENFKFNKNSVLLGSYSFWEGLDIEEENLKLVAIDKLPFAPPGDPLKLERINSLKIDGKNPFFEYQIPEAVMSLKQGFGRLIRSRRHRGILALFDKRIKTKNYGKIFLKNLPDVQIFSDIEEIKKFFKNII